MANHIGTSLSRLFREISYAKGELSEIESSARRIKRRFQPILRDYKEALARRRAQLARLAELEATLAERTGLSAKEIRETRKLPKKLGLPHGAFIAALVSFLKTTDAPIDTVSIVKHMAKELDLPVGTPAEYDLTRRSIVEKLRRLAARGAVERLPDGVGDSGRLVGRWVWKGL